MKIVVSSCLMGKAVRYDATAYWNTHPILESLKQRVEIINFCPEIEGGLPVPRDPAEINSALNILTLNQKDVTKFFIVGAFKLEAICKENKIEFAILKERSPSCGVHEIYDGTFTGTIKPGVGVATAMLRELKIPLFSENEIEEAYRFWETLEKK